uniref:Uncharacterized protein n=1 Tax=Tanacetum cinerariifolium TaxID=118510 RepID=A0A699K3H4_TANCI|nr:hypothetical protein [Tanacetum cinerariifolium]
MIALIAKNKMKLVTGEFPEPTMESDLREVWKRKNDMLILCVLNIVMKQENCSVEVYYHKLKRFWDEYDALEASYMCIYVCNYNNRRTNGERDQRKRLIQFLMGFDEGYSNIRGQILLMQPLPSVAIAYTMLRQEEKQREGSNLKHMTTTILNLYTNRINTANPNTYFEKRSAFRKGIYYGSYGKEGYYQEECYKIVGYPVRHHLYGKYQPPKITKPAHDIRLPRAVNMVVGQDDSRTQASLTTQDSL